MKTIFTIAIFSILLLSACSGPAEDVPRAQVEAPSESAPAMEAISAPAAETEPVTMTSTAYQSVNKETSSFNFEGFGPGKSHVGTFEDWQGTILMEDGEIVGGNIIINAASVKTESSGLDNHLQSKDFFNVKLYPEITFENGVISGSEMSGTLTFHGVSKDITFPVERLDDGVKADFVVDTSLYGMTYTGVSEEVRIFFEMRV